jgi:hypothetical protein
VYKDVKLIAESREIPLVYLSPNVQKTLSKMVDTIIQTFGVTALENIPKNTPHILFLKEYEAWNFEMTASLIETCTQLKQLENICLTLFVDYCSDPKHFV